MAGYIGISNKQGAQLAQLNQIEKSYSTEQSANEIIKDYEGGEIIPIYTPEQFAMVGTGETSYVAETGKIYTYSTDKTYMFYGQGEDITESLKGMIIEIMYPVGSIYISTTEQNPGEYFGGTWEAYGQGRTIVGAGEGTDSNGTSKTFVAESTGGEYTHTLTVSEMPSHTHTQNPHSHTINNQGGWGAGSSNTARWRADGNSPANNWGMSIASTTATNKNTGGSGAHNNIQPYITCYIWKRVA